MSMGTQIMLVMTFWPIHALPPSIPLHLSTFTLDEFEAALRHNTSDPPCALIAEIHATLIYNLRTVPFDRKAGMWSLEPPETPQLFGVCPLELREAMVDCGNNWERVPLRAAEGREGWEEALVGCLTDVSSFLRLYDERRLIASKHSPETFPLFQHVLTWLLFESEITDKPVGSPCWTSSSCNRNHTHVPRATPSERYWTMPVEYKIALLSFMCGLSVSSKAIHLHMESCEEQLTALRKEKIMANRFKKGL